MRSARSAGLQRSTWPTAPWMPASRTTPISSRASSAVAASGFSTRTWTPAAASSRTARRCSSVGTATIAKSGGARRGQQLVDGREDQRASRDGPEAVAARIDGTGEAHGGVGLEDAGVVAAHHSEAEHRAAQRFMASHGPTRVSAMAATDAPGLFLHPDAQIGADVTFGANVVVHAGVVLGDGVSVQDGAILGKPVVLGPKSTASRDAPPPLRIGAGARICAAGDPARRRRDRRAARSSATRPTCVSARGSAPARSSARARRSTTTRSSAIACGSSRASTSRPT